MAEIFKGLLPTVLLQSSPSICHKVNGNKKLAVSSSNGLYVIRYYYSKHDAMMNFRRRWGIIPRIFSSVLSEISGQIPYPSTLTPSKKSGILWREIRASSTDSLDMIGEKYVLQWTRRKSSSGRRDSHFTIITTEPDQIYITLYHKLTKWTTPHTCPVFSTLLLKFSDKQCVRWEIFSFLCCEKYLFNIWQYLIHPLGPYSL